MNILIVDDEPCQRDILRRVAEAWAAKRGVNVHVIEAANFPEAAICVGIADVIVCVGHFPMLVRREFNMFPWFYVHGLVRAEIHAGSKRFCVVTGDDVLADAAELLHHVKVFRKPYRAQDIMDWVFQEQSKVNNRQLTAA